MDIRLQIWRLNLQEHVLRLYRLLPDPYERTAAVLWLIHLGEEVNGSKSVTTLMDTDDAAVQRMMREHAELMREQGCWQPVAPGISPGQAACGRCL